MKSPTRTNASADNVPDANDGIFEAKKSANQELLGLNTPSKRNAAWVTARDKAMPTNKPVDGQARRKATDSNDAMHPKKVAPTVRTVTAMTTVLSEGATSLASEAKSQTYASIKNSPNSIMRRVAATRVSAWPKTARFLIAYPLGYEVDCPSRPYLSGPGFRQQLPNCRSKRATRLARIDPAQSTQIQFLLPLGVSARRNRSRSLGHLASLLASRLAIK